MHYYGRYVKVCTKYEEPYADGFGHRMARTTGRGTARMRYPYATRGVAKLYLAELLRLASVALLATGVLRGIVGSQGAAEGDVHTLGVFTTLIAGIALPFAASLLAWLGLRQAGKDEPIHLRTARGLALVVIVLTLLDGIATGLGFDDHGIVESVLAVLGILITMHTIQGIATLMQHARRHDLADASMRVLLAYIAARAAAIPAAIVRVEPARTVVLLLTGALVFAAYVYYLRFLRKAYGVLERR